MLSSHPVRRPVRTATGQPYPLFSATRYCDCYARPCLFCDTQGALRVRVALPF